VFPYASTALYSGHKWYDKVSNAVVQERIKLPDLKSHIADRRHSLFGHICCLPENTSASQALLLSIDTHTGTPPAADWKRPPGRPRRTWLLNKSKRTMRYLLVSSRSQAKISRWGCHYDPQRSEWVSECISHCSILLQQTYQITDAATLWMTLHNDKTARHQSQY